MFYCVLNNIVPFVWYSTCKMSGKVTVQSRLSVLLGDLCIVFLA